MADWDVILAPATVKVRVVLNEALSVLHSLKLVNIVHMHSGLGEWTQETAKKLPPERIMKNKIVVEVVDHITHITKSLSIEDGMTFPDVITAMKLAQTDSYRESMLGWVREKSKDYKADNYPGDDALLASVDTYVNYMRDLLEEKWAKKGFEFDDDPWVERYNYILSPEQLKADSVEHLEYMWENYLKPEWKRVKPTLQETIDAFEQVDFTSVTGFEAIEIVTGRNMRGKEDFEDSIREADTLTFVPCAHIGPYIGWGPCEDFPRELLFVFGPRMPKNAPVKSTALGRNELLVRMNALADETRLRILELLTQNEELCAQDFITELDLSQSSASRHLRQLSASGFVSERRRDVAKCYSLNKDRINDTITALKLFLNTD